MGNELKYKINLRSFVMIGTLFIMWILFAVLTNGKFLAPRNLSNLTRQMAIVSILGTGMVLVIITSNIDLSVGSVMGALGGMAAAIHIWDGINIYQTMIIVFASGILIGLIQGYIIAYLAVPAFIVTLGGLLFFRGLLLAITKGISIAPFVKSYVFLGQGYVPPSIGWIVAVIVCLGLIISSIHNRKSRLKYYFEVNSAKKFILKLIVMSLIILFITFVLNRYKGIPVPVLIMLILVLIFTIIAEYTTFGRSIYAMGGNKEATIYSGINVKRNLMLVFGLMGAMSAIAGMLLSARLNAGTPSAGMNMELDAIAAAVIGGTSMTGGSGKVAGAILGALFMGTIDNGMSMVNLDSYWQYMVKGIILVVAVWFDIRSNKKSK